METIANQTQVATWFFAGGLCGDVVAVAVSCAALLLLHSVSSGIRAVLAHGQRIRQRSAQMAADDRLRRMGIEFVRLDRGLVAPPGNDARQDWPSSFCSGGIGQTMGALFDINHKLHGPAAMIGIPSLCVATLLITLALVRQPGHFRPPLWSAHLPWIMFALMIGTFILFFSSLKAVGVDMSGQSGPLKELPAGVSGYVWLGQLAFFSQQPIYAAVPHSGCRYSSRHRDDHLIRRRMPGAPARMCSWHAGLPSEALRA